MLEEFNGHLLSVLYCCRPWVVAVTLPMGRCGLCGERPYAQPTRSHETVG